MIYMCGSRIFGSACKKAVSNNGVKFYMSMVAPRIHLRAPPSSYVLLQNNYLAVDAQVPSSKSDVKDTHDDSNRFRMERVLSAALVPLIPATLFIHNGYVDFVLATAIALHFHWGMDSVVADYVRPSVFNDLIASLARIMVCVMSAVFYTVLLMFNYNDVGITKAFEMLWSL